MNESYINIAYTPNNTTYLMNIVSIQSLLINNPSCKIKIYLLML